MIPLGWEEVEALGLGRLDGRPEDGVLRRVHDDSRDARPGDLFVALNTGTRFVGDARAHGAATLVPENQEAALAALPAGRDVVLQAPRIGVLRPPEPSLDLVGDVAAGDGYEAHGVGLHGRRDGADELGQVLLDVPVGIDDQRHHGPLEASNDGAIIGHGSLHLKDFYSGRNSSVGDLRRP